MDYIVLVKEIPQLDSVVFDELGLVDYDKSSTVMNPRDKHALEAALELRTDADRVLAITVGYQRKVLEEAVGIGADHGYLIDTMDVEGWDGRTSAQAIFGLVKKLTTDGELSSDYLIVAGSTAEDFNSGQTAVRVAGYPGIPQLTFVEEVSINGTDLVAKVNENKGYAELSVPLPALITVTETANEPRYGALQRKLKAKNDMSFYTTLALADLGVTLEERTELIASDEPPTSADAKMFTGEIDDFIDELVDDLRKDGAVKR